MPPRHFDVLLTARRAVTGDGAPVLGVIACILVGMSVSWGRQLMPVADGLLCAEWWWASAAGAWRERRGSTGEVLRTPVFRASAGVPALTIADGTA